MFGISYGELFIILGATAAIIGPKDLPRIAKHAGRLAGRAIGYVQLARGQFDSVMQQSQASKVHKELQDAMAQIEAIRYEIRSISVMNPGPFTRRLENVEPTENNAGHVDPVKPDAEGVQMRIPKDLNSGSLNLQSQAIAYAKMAEVASVKASSGSKYEEEPKDLNSGSLNLHSQAIAYAKIAELASVKASSSSKHEEEPKDDDGLLTVLPVSADSAGLLPKRPEEAMGSDIVLEAILEAEVAKNAQHFFSQPQNQLPEK